MKRQILFAAIFTLVAAETIAPGFDRTVNEGVNSLGYKVLYGDEDLTVVNEVVTSMEKAYHSKSKNNLNESLKPLDPVDVKCLMSVNQHCTKEMSQIKSILVQSLKDECKTCSNDQREKAGKVAASMMAYDPMAWKMFLTRSAIHIKSEKNNHKVKRHTEEPRLKLVGEPEEIVDSKYRHIKPGFKVRVKRYAAQIIG